MAVFRFVRVPFIDTRSQYPFWGFEVRLRNPDCVYQANSLLQQIENEIRERMSDTEPDVIEPKIRFPRGYIPKVDALKAAYPCNYHIIGKNIAYTLQFHSLLRWFLTRTDIDWTARKMIIKYGIISINSIIEGLVWCKLKERGIQPAKKDFSKNLDKMVQNRIIGTTLADMLKKIHQKRSKIHLELYQIMGDEDFTVEDWNKAVEALQLLNRRVQE